MKKASDEIILIIGVMFSYFMLGLAVYLEVEFLLWLSLLVIVAIAGFYSVTFFKSKTPFQKLFYYLFTLFLIIGYFALVYKSFGIIDSSTNTPIKPDWLNSFYFSVVTWTTLGYGDFRPPDHIKTWVMVEALMGYMFMGLLIGKVLYITTEKSKEISTS